jgi:hypothetical protein
VTRLVLFAALALAACNPYLNQQSVAPPGRAARLDAVDGFWGIKHYRLEVSQGVALAITCFKGGPCEKMKVLSDDPAVAEVRTASLARLDTMGYANPNPQPASAFVVVGKNPGTTRIRVSAREGTRNLFVTVIAPPAINPQTVAVSPE